MGSRSQVIKQSIEAFRYGGGTAKFAQIINALKKGPFRNLHFDSANSILKKLIEATPERLFVELNDNGEGPSGTRLSSRQILFCNLYMTVKASDENVIVPVSQRMDMTTSMLISCIRAFPLSISSQHTEFRYIQRTSKVLQYNDEPFRFAAAFCLPLSTVLSSHVLDDGKLIPCVIPHARGLFLATASYLSAEDAGPKEIVSFYRNVMTGAYTVGTIEGSSMLCRAALKIKTFVSHRELSDGQHALHRLFRPFMEDPKTLEALNYGIDMFSWGPLGFDPKTTFAQRKAWHEVCDRVRAVVASPEWKAETAAAMRHFRRYNIS